MFEDPTRPFSFRVLSQQFALGSLLFSVLLR